MIALPGDRTVAGSALTDTLPTYGLRDLTHARERSPDLASQWTL